MTTTELRCADKVHEMMQQREEEIRSLQERAEESEYYGDEERIHELALSVETSKLTTVCLSYGGPADYLEIYHNEGEITRVVYRFSDWFDTATADVREGDALWSYAQFIIEGE